MKKVLFIHDGPRWKNNEGTQFGSTTDIDMFMRYKFLGETVKFMMRVFERRNTSGLVNLNAKGLEIIEVPPFNRPHLFGNYFRSKKIITKAVKEHDMLIIRLPSTIGSIAVNEAEKWNIPYLVEVVACPWDSLTNHSLLGKIYAPFSMSKLKKLVKKAPYVIYVTNKFLQERYPNKNNNIGISDVMLDTFADEILTSKIAHYQQIENNSTIRLATLAATDVRYKGQEYVIKALSLLRESKYNFEYNIVGGGSSERLKSLVKKLRLEDQVKFMGRIDHKEIFSLLDNIDIYIQPSKQEGLPRALVEAMSRACVCISSNVGGMPELLNDSMIFEAGNSEELANIINKTLDNDCLISEARKNFQKAKEFEQDRLNIKRRQFYKKFIQGVT